MASTQNATLNKPGLLYNAGTFNGPINPDIEPPTERPRQVASTADAVLSIIDHNPIFMVGTDEAAGELRMLEDAQRMLEQRIRN